jgi:hypothetical protein
MKTSTLVALLLLGSINFISAQSQIAGRVLTENNGPLAFANVLLLRQADSSLVKGQVTKEDGTFRFEQVPPSTYLIAISAVSYTKLYTGIVEITSVTSTKDLGSFIVKEDANLLKTVEIVAKKPMFEQKLDRLVVNVSDNITAAGSTALEVLERSPGVVVNRQNNSISLSGKDGVVVMLNGKLTYMPMDAVVQMLSSLSADNIEKLELLSTPPANLDAEGNAGYINIVLKRREDQGFNGSVSATVGYGKGETGNTSLNLNYQKGKANVFGGYTYLRNGQENPMRFSRRVGVGANTVETDTRSDRFPTRNNHNARLGLDYNISKKTVLGLLCTAYDTKWEMQANNLSEKRINGSLDTIIRIASEEVNQWRHYGGNMHVQHTFSKRSSLLFDADYLYYYDNNPVDYENRFFNNSEVLVGGSTARSSKKTPIRIGVGKLDYIHTFKDEMKLETGVKATVSNFGNDVKVEELNGTVWVPQPGLTANYHLDEEILAAYATLERKLTQKTSAKIGLRYEYTDSNLGSNEQENIVDRQYGRFFPSLFVSHEFNKKNQMSISFSRRITRPTFNEMAPFVIFVDPTTSFSGNSALQPAFSNTLKLDYKMASTLFSLQHTIEDSTIARFQSRVQPGTNTQYSTSVNLKQSRTSSFTIGHPYSPTKWWRMYINSSIVYTESDFYLYDNELLTVQNVNYNLFSSQTFTLPKSFSFELSGFYNSGGLWGTAKNKPFGAVNAGLQKKLAGKGGNLSLGYDNFLNTLVFRGTFDVPQQNQYFSSRLQFNQPTIKLTYARNFGSNKVKSASKRASAEDERKRVGD